MSLISVIVPVYKVEPYLERCVDSLLGQTFSDFDLVLVDDASPDSCGQICERYAAKDPRVFTVHRENGGLSAARNTGLDWVFSHSDSAWIAFVDSDDWVREDYLEKLYQAAVGQQAELAICGVTNIYDRDWDGPPMYETELPTETIDGLTALSRIDTAWHYIVVWNKLYKKTLFNSLRFPVGKFHEDEFLVHRVFHLCKRIAIINNPLYFYFHRNGSIMKTAVYPKRFDYWEALEERLSFYRDCRYPELFQQCFLFFFRQITADIKLLHTGKNKDGKTRKRLIQIMEQQGKKYRFEIDYSIYQVFLTSIDHDHFDLEEKCRFLKYYFRLTGIKGIIKKTCCRRSK